MPRELEGPSNSRREEYDDGVVLLRTAADGSVKTDLGVYPVGTVPTTPTVGVSVADPVFGTLVMRVTNASTGGGNNYGTSYSYWPTFNCDNTRILACNLNDASAKLYVFDPDTFTLGSSSNAPSGVGSFINDVKWSAINPDYMYGLGQIAPTIRRMSVSGNNWTTIKDLAATFPGKYFGQISVSDDDDVFAFKVFDDTTYAVTGYAVFKVSTDTVIYNISTTQLDEVQIDKTGRYLAVKTALQGADAIEVKTVDLNGPTVTDLEDDSPDYAPGHSDNGTGVITGLDNWRDAVTWRTFATPHTLTTLITFGVFQFDAHISALADNEDWVLLSTFSALTSNVTFRQEMFLLKTDGSGDVRRFLHHYSIFTTYYSSPRANVSRDGRWIAFTSNWGVSGGRQDLYIAKIPDSAAYPPTNGDVTWNNTSNVTISAPNIYLSGGYFGYANSDQQISSDENSYFQFTVAGNDNVYRYTDVYLMAASGAPYTTHTGYKLHCNFELPSGMSVYKETVYQTGNTGDNDDVFRIGFDASNHLQVTKNGSAIWTDGSTTASGDYVLLVKFQDDSNPPGLKAVTYQQ